MAHFTTSMTSFRILNDFFRNNDHWEDMRAHHFGFHSKGPFMPKREIDRLSAIFIHASYRSLRFRRPNWNTLKWYKPLARRAVPFLMFVREHHFSRAPQQRARIDTFIKMTKDFLDYANRVSSFEHEIQRQGLI
jgi:hypothetical protein